MSTVPPNNRIDPLEPGPPRRFYRRVPGVVLLTWPLQYVVFLSLGFVVGRDFWT